MVGMNVDHIHKLEEAFLSSDEWVDANILTNFKRL